MDGRLARAKQGGPLVSPPAHALPHLVPHLSCPLSRFYLEHQCHSQNGELRGSQSREDNGSPHGVARIGFAVACQTCPASLSFPCPVRRAQLKSCHTFWGEPLVYLRWQDNGSPHGVARIGLPTTPCRRIGSLAHVPHHNGETAHGGVSTQDHHTKTPHAVGFWSLGSPHGGTTLQA